MKKVAVSDTAISGVNIVPVIGVTLVLLVILIVMSPVMNLPNLEVDLPEAVTKEAKDQNITVSLGADGQISVDSQIVEWKDLPRTLRATLKEREDQDVVIIVRADKNLPYGNIERLVRVVNFNAGDKAVALATKQRKKALLE